MNSKVFELNLYQKKGDIFEKVCFENIPNDTKLSDLELYKLEGGLFERVYFKSIQELSDENFGCFDPLVVRYLKNDILATVELLKRINMIENKKTNNLYLKEKNIMKYKITVNNEGFAFELKEKQLKKLYDLQEEKINKISEIFDFGNIPPHHSQFIYEHDENDEDILTNGGVFSHITPQFKEKEQGEEVVELLSTGTSLAPFIKIVFDGNVYIDDVLYEDFLTIKQEEYLLSILKAQKDRAKSLFMKLWRESDMALDDPREKYCIQYSNISHKLDTRYLSKVKLLTPVFSYKKKDEIIDIYKDELMWYFKEYNPLVTMYLKIEEEK